MIKPGDFCELVKKFNINFYSGVPDSLLKNLCAYIEQSYPAKQHIIAANEGNAVAIAMGRYMSTGQPAAVYLQNSGLGNTVNPLTSLADQQVYSIPMLLIIGWRGQPGVKDEPQHIKQGQITEQLLQILGMPYVVLEAESKLSELLEPLMEKMLSHNQPVAILVKKNCFSALPNSEVLVTKKEFKREQALAVLLSLFAQEDIVVSTTGKTSRELFELRQQRQEKTNDFLTVGGMGHTSSIAMGVALGAPERRVIAIDGDGSMLMHMGALPIIGCHKVTNLVHIVLNNECHESVGGQPTIAGELDMQKMAIASGYQGYFCAEHKQAIVDKWSQLTLTTGPVLFEIKIAKGARADLGRPTTSPVENKKSFMQHLGQMK